MADNPSGSFSSAPAGPTTTSNGGTGTSGTSDPSTAQASHISSLSLSPTAVVGGSPSIATVVLTKAAPAAGAKVTLKSAIPTIAKLPASVTIPSGKTSATVKLTTAAVTSGEAIPLTASYNSSTAGANLIVYPPAAPSDFTVAMSPASLTLQPGASGTAQITTQATGSFNQALALEVASQPAGISVTLSSSGIAAPGSGTAELHVSAADNASAGNYMITIDVTDGSLTHTATLQLTVGSSSGGGGGSGGSGMAGPLQGCWYHSGGHKYQAVDFSMQTAGTINFDANLYFGATCGDWADRFGFGQPLTLGGFGYIFWFRDFKDQTGTSAIWTLGSETSQCIDYSTAPDC